MTTPSDGARALHERVSALFAEIRALQGPERAAALDAIADGTVRAEVESLLRYDEPDTDADAVAPDACDAFPPGMEFGPYRVVRRLGRGATGVVLLGEQSEPVRRRVAIKVVPQAMLDAAHAARFDFERRALERTEHPGIPAVLDAGRTAQGLPYIVMEFVDGEPITAFCERHGLGVVERIGLVVAVAGAVQHAHQRGLIHRDLKPGNILVGGDRADPRAKLVDFGIARGVEAGDSPTLTLGRPIGTLAYMPPEQAFGGVVDTRADIYALGAVLYELAAGRPPLVGADANKALEQIRVGVPAQASRVRRDAPIPGDRTPATLWADLDRVLACALEKGPARRYATAEAFAEDLKRLVRREPVNARPQSAAYRLARLVERNKAASAAAALAVVAVGVGVAGLGVGYAEAERQRAVADERAETLGAVNRFLIDDLLAAISPDEIAADTPAVVLLDRAARKIDGRFPDRPLLAAELHYTLGRSYTQLSAFDQAERELARATSLAGGAGGDESAEAVRSRLASASLLASRQRFEEALAAYESLLPLGERVLGPDAPAMHMAWNDAGVAMDSSGRHAEGEALLARALEARRRTLGPDDPQVLLTLSNLAQARDAQGDGAGALELMLEAARVAGAMPDAPTMLLIGLHNNIGATYLDLERPADAAPHLEKASALAQDWFGPDDPTALILLSNLASLRSDLGDADGAIEAFGRVVAGLTELVGPEAYDTLIARQGLWTAHLSRGDAAGAEAGFAELVAGCERGLGADHWLTAACLVSHAKALQSLGRLPEARAAAGRGHAVFLAVLGPEHSRTSTAGALVAELDRALVP
jgi:tetratricopeptide (TPR) repeat protein